MGSGSELGIYLPIAEISVNIFVLFGMGAAVGFLSGMFGVGGGFLITPLLIFYNIPPAVAVATGANQVIASSFTGALTHFKRGSLDVKLGTLLVIGGIVGAAVGIYVFVLLRELGQLDLIVSLLYVIFLSTIGGLMLLESIRSMRRTKAGQLSTLKKPGQHNWVHRLPFKMRFRASKIYVSIIPILALGAAIGFLSSIMGVGGGFIMVPAMIYLLKVPTNVVIGTSLYQIVFVTAFTTVMQATTNQSVDIVLAFLLMSGGVIGAQYGTRIGQKLRGEQLRALLATLVLAVGLRLAIELFVTPDDLYSIAIALVTPGAS
ncbi:sulfite exporter TauE/SafE family protein [Phyllobacterium myrsinacearum]|uniref:sulfite exporter TauE/SafE family protein n=1 Tax=Phyllobacterium myrsinacearum TaxID=28101 RepID=UPI0015F8D928|nr:sulfite exporter TauE/SafE family protein [Phyllobacterium myrsinacearum]